MQGHQGTWYVNADPWGAAHESGHIMKLPDRYMEPTPGVTVPMPGWEGTIMAQHLGTVTAADRQEIRDALCGGGQ